MRYLLIALLLFIGCDDDNPVAPTIDCAGVSGGSAVINECDLCVGGTSDVVDLCDADEDGYDDRDIQVLQDIIDVNPSLSGQNPLDIGYSDWNDGKLTYLQLDNHQLTSLPESIGNLSNLQELALYFNQLTSLPESIGNLSNLQELALWGNQLTSIPESIGNLSNLEYLQLGGNQLTTLPESIGNLSNLKQFHSNVNQLTSIPASIGNLSNLEILSIHANILTSLPESICNLNNCNRKVGSNYLCEEYHHNCIEHDLLWDNYGNWPQDQSNCCEGENDDGEIVPNWTICP
jgi:hypothetical protein